MSNIKAVFPPPQTLSIKETISTDLPQFIPHHEVIFMGISDIFSSRITSISAAAQSYLDSLKSSSDADKAIASEIARWHNQIDFAKGCVADIDNNALCKRMQLMLNNVGEDRKQIKDEAATSYQTDDEHKFVLLDYNLQTFSGATSDANAIKVLLEKESETMKSLLSNNKCSWRFHLIYAALLSRLTLDTNAVQAQIDLAQTKLGSDANSHYGYLALIGDIYLKIRQFDKARDALNKACAIMKNDGYCRTRLIYCYLYEQDFKQALQIWTSCVSDLKNSGISDEILTSYTNYIALYQNLDDEKNNEAIMQWSGDDSHSFVATSLKLFILAYKSGKYIGDDKFAMFELPEYESSSSWTAKNSDLAQNGSHGERMMASTLKYFVDMYINDDGDGWDTLGPVLDNVFASFSRPLLDDILDALCLEQYLLGMFKLRWKGDCKNAFRFSITCNCRMNMNSYVGEVIGFQNAGMSDLAVQKIQEIQKFVNVAALELFPIDAKRMKEDEKEVEEAANDLVALIKQNNENYDAMLALADLYLAQGKWQSSILVMQQPVEAATMACSKNLELRMKWGTALYFNGYLPLAMQIFREYVTKPVEAAAHEYYCGIAANIFLELGKMKQCTSMEKAGKLKGGNLWLYRFLCYKYWIELFGKKKKKKKSQYDKAVDSAKKMIKLCENHPLGHALLARSNIELVESVDNMSERIEASVAKAVELADKLLASKEILPRMYYESMVHCGVAMYQIGKDGSSYYNRACDNAPHGETQLCKLQREKITSKMDTTATRALLTEITKKQLNMDPYKKACAVFEFNIDAVTKLGSVWDIFSPHSDLAETGEIGRNITKPDVDPNGGGAKKGKSKKKAKTKAKAVPDTDDHKAEVRSKPPVGTRASVAIEDELEDACGVSGGGFPVESAWKYANLCTDSWPQNLLTFSLPFDDASQMGSALTMLLRREMAAIGLAPQDENDIIGRLQWCGEEALQFVLDKCEGKSDPLHLGLANFAFVYKVDMGLGSDEHKAVIDKVSSSVKHLSYEGKIGYAALRGLQCVTFEADDLYKGLANEADADGNKWLYHRHYGEYLLVIKHDYVAAVTELEAAYKSNQKKDPMTIGCLMTALSKSKAPQAHDRMAIIFDEIGKYHEKITDAAVIREEFLQDFEIRNAKSYDNLTRENGASSFQKTRQLICAAKYDRKFIESLGGIKACTKDLKPSASNAKLFRILTLYFKTQAHWMYNNCLKQCTDGMTNAAQLCMDWALGPSMTAYCFMKQQEYEMAEGSLDELPTKTFDPIMLQCAGMICNSLTDDMEMNKSVSRAMFISRINNLRFTKAKNIDLALKELTQEFLTKYKQDFNALVTLADILLNRGAIKACYCVYFTIKSLYPSKYACNFVLRLKFAESMRLNGYQSEALNEFRTVYNSFDSSEKTFKSEMSAITSVLIGFVLLNLSIADYEMAETVLKVLDRKHPLVQLSNAYLTLLKEGAKSASNVYRDCVSQTSNPLALALAVQAAKLSGDDAAAPLAKLKELINGKYAAIKSLVEYCQLSAGLLSDSSADCLTNVIVATTVKSAEAGANIYDAFKNLYATNKWPSAKDINGALSGANVARVTNENAITLIKNAQAVKIAEITDNYEKLNADAVAEIEAAKAGKIEQAPVVKSSGAKKGAKSNKKSRASFKGSASVSAGAKPKVDYSATPLQERKKWAFNMAENLPAPKSKQVVNWSANDIAEFIKKIPIFGLNEWYGNKFHESGVTGKMFLDCNEQKLIKWGVDRKCHRARFRAEALAMKRRG